MANMSLFRAYGTKNDAKSTQKQVEELEIVLESDESTVAQQEQKKAKTPKKTPKITEHQVRQGRPPKNPGVNMMTRTYKLQEEVVEAMEEKFYENRKNWNKNMTFSKYLSNLIWADTHNGEKLYDESTGEAVVDLTNL